MKNLEEEIEIQEHLRHFSKTLKNILTLSKIGE